MTEPKVQVVPGLVVNPGDTLVIRVHPADVQSTEELEAFRAKAVEALEGVRVIVLAVEAMAVKRGTP